MIKTSIFKKSFAFILAITVALSFPSFAASAAGSDIDNELARAVNLGIGAKPSSDPQITYAQFMKMLDHTVELADNSLLTKWKKLLPEARKSEKRMTRFNGMLAIMYTADFLGGNYAEFNADWAHIHDSIGDVWGECVPDNDIWGNWPEKKVNAGFQKSRYTYDWTYHALSYFYSFGRMSVVTKHTIFDYNAAKNSMRPAEKFTYKEALLAALRLYESVKPVSERYATTEDKAILGNANALKSSILNSSTTVKVAGTSYYVANDGNDNNDGLTPATAWATMDKVDHADLKYGDGVFFKRGDLWRIQPVYCKDGVTYSAYGEGEKPRIYASQENSSGADKWKLLAGTKNIWVYYKDMPFCGYMVFNEGESFAQKRWVYWNGTQYVKDGTNDRFSVNELKNLEYFNDIDLKGWNHYVEKDLIVYDCPKTGKLYLRCDEGNPGLIYDSIEIAPKYDQVALLELSKDNVLDNLCIMYYGNCGIIGNGIVQNCELAYFGGANFAFYFSDKRAGGAGGGINVGVTVEAGKGMHIVNNYIHESYDEGITIECGWNGEDYGEKFSDILIQDNLFEKNRHDCWISSFMEERKGIIFKNITYDGNMFLYTGAPSCSKNRETTPEDAGISINDPGERNIENVIVKNNTFYISRFALVFINSGQKEDIKFSGNTYVTNNNAVFLARGYDESTNYYNFSGNAPEQYLNDRSSTILPVSFTPSLVVASATVKAGTKYQIPLANVNSITKVTYKITGGSKYVSVSPKGVVTAQKAGTAKIAVTFSNGINKDITQTFTITVKK
jgi:hypothetical protein